MGDMGGMLGGMMGGDMGGMLGAMGGAGALGGLMAMAAGGGGGMPQAPSANNPAEFNERAAQAIPAEVHMFSGESVVAAGSSMTAHRS